MANNDVIDRAPASIGQAHPQTGGWFYWATEYPDEGAVFPFETLADAVKHGEAADYTFTDALLGEVDRLNEELRASRARVATLEGVVAAVVDIHSPNHDPDGWQFCNECKADYQCRTARAMDAAMADEGV